MQCSHWLIVLGQSEADPWASIGNYASNIFIFRSTMKISQWALPAAAVGSRLNALDKNWNKNRPLYNASPARSYTDLTTLFPNQMRRDPALFQRAEARYFPEVDGKRQFNPIKNHRGWFSNLVKCLLKRE